MQAIPSATAQLRSRARTRPPPHRAAPSPIARSCPGGSGSPHRERAGATAPERARGRPASRLSQGVTQRRVAQAETAAATREPRAALDGPPPMPAPARDRERARRRGRRAAPRAAHAAAASAPRSRRRPPARERAPRQTVRRRACARRAPGPARRRRAARPVAWAGAWPCTRPCPACAPTTRARAPSSSLLAPRQPPRACCRVRRAPQRERRRQRPSLPRSRGSGASRPGAGERCRPAASWQPCRAGC
mmetsp:Transcript_3944/g.12351  ORF Transcript_3944/g.12351 Transcript_3944/m.12351 type:complete len:248 (-) Transcript_3944:76-819(-)